jgi:Integrin alpha
MDLQVMVGKVEQCREYAVNVKYNQHEIFKPIELELHYEIVNKIPDEAKFCDTCVATNPSDGKLVKNKVVFSTGCAGSTCMTDLKVRSALLGVK